MKTYTVCKNLVGYGWHVVERDTETGERQIIDTCFAKSDADEFAALLNAR